MADQTITETTLDDGRIRYELGRTNWESRLVPDIRQPESALQIPVDRLIDVVILGDGYLTPDDFREELAQWLAAFFKLTVYDTFAGGIRVRALYTPSGEPASAARNSFFGCAVNDAGTGIVKSGDWWSAGDTKGRLFRQRLWDAVDSFGDVNARAYPPELDLGVTADIAGDLRGMYGNAVVSMLVRTAARTNVSGMTTQVRREPPDESRQVRVAFGANSIHELSHALGLLSDEYIDGRGGRSTRSNPEVASVYTLSNLSYADTDDSVPWLHLAPAGQFRRTGSGVEPSPVAGWLWIGGVKQFGVWHAEYRCLMNGTHDNFAYTQVASQDATANPDGTYTDEEGAPLRDVDHFCSWCQEIVVLRILEKNGQLAEPGDPADPNEQGRIWYARWTSDLRAKYYRLFNVGAQIHQAESRYEAMSPGAGGEALWTSDLYSVPRASRHQDSSRVRALADDEVFLLLGS
jgi:hypothetical protein